MAEAAWPCPIMAKLAADRPIFHSEADFQHAFAWQVHLMYPDTRIRLEVRPDPEVREAVDMLCVVGGSRVAVEFKYLVRSFETVVDGEHFRLRDQGAQPLSRYDVMKDIQRLERFCGDRRADVGYAVVLSNDPQIWSRGRVGSIDETFRMYEGASISGAISWAPHAGPGTTRGRDKILNLRGAYRVNWLPYAPTEATVDAPFRYLVVTVGA